MDRTQADRLAFIRVRSDRFERRATLTHGPNQVLAPAHRPV
ncbi:hypothetical protein ACFFWA_27000 [Actinomadura verrucosospora]